MLCTKLHNVIFVKYVVFKKVAQFCLNDSSEFGSSILNKLLQHKCIHKCWKTIWIDSTCFWFNKLLTLSNNVKIKLQRQAIFLTARWNFTTLSADPSAPRQNLSKFAWRGRDILYGSRKTTIFSFEPPDPARDLSVFARPPPPDPAHKLFPHEVDISDYREKSFRRLLRVELRRRAYRERGQLKVPPQVGPDPRFNRLPANIKLGHFFPLSRPFN